MGSAGNFFSRSQQDLDQIESSKLSTHRSQNSRNKPSVKFPKRSKTHTKIKTVKESKANFNSTIANIVHQIADHRVSEDRLSQLKEGGHTIYLPRATNEFDDEFELQQGYVSDDAGEALRNSPLSGNIFGYDDDGNNQDLSKLNLDVLRDLRTKVQERTNETDKDKPKISHPEDLTKVLFPSDNSYANLSQTFTIATDFRKSKSGESLEVIQENLMQLILKYIYKELHNGLIELGDNFLEERRKYFQKNFETYISIINFFLKSKEEFFLGVLSELMSKLSISQILLDNSFVYYMNEAEQTESIKNIRHAYDEVYKAGMKYSIAPKVLTRIKLKKILKFQIELFKELQGKHPDLTNEVLEIIVTDHIYYEYGFDKEAIRAAIEKHQIDSDKSFDELIEELDKFRDNSFLNM